MNGGVSRRKLTNGWIRRLRADTGYTALSTWVGIKRASVRLSVDVFYSLLSTLKLNDSNPTGPLDEPRRGPILHPFRPHEALPDYLWYGIRDGLMTVVQR